MDQNWLKWIDFDCNVLVRLFMNTWWNIVFSMHDEILHESMINHDLAFEDVTLNLGLLESSSGCSHFKKFDKIGCQYVQCILWVQMYKFHTCSIHGIIDVKCFEWWNWYKLFWMVKYFINPHDKSWLTFEKMTLEKLELLESSSGCSRFNKNKRAAAQKWTWSFPWKWNKIAFHEFCSKLSWICV